MIRQIRKGSVFVWVDGDEVIAARAGGRTSGRMGNDDAEKVPAIGDSTKRYATKWMQQPSKSNRLLLTAEITIDHYRHEKEIEEKKEAVLKSVEKMANAE